MAHRNARLIKKMQKLHISPKKATVTVSIEKKKKRRPLASTTQGSDVPTWGQVKQLISRAQELVKQQNNPVTPITLFLAMLATISCVPSVNAATYWAYVPDPPLLQPISWSEAKFLVFYNDTVYGPLIGNIKQINMSVNYTNWFNTYPVCLSPLNLETGCVKAISYEHTDVYEETDQSVGLSGSPGILHFTGTNITLACPATSQREDLKDTIIWYKNGQPINIRGRISYASPLRDSSITITKVTGEDSGNYFCMKHLSGEQGILIAEHKVTILNRKSKNQFPPFMTVNFPESNFERCNASWNNQIWCTVDYTKGSVLISSIPVIDRFITFQKNWDIWKLALTYSNTHVITCVAPPYTLLIGSVNIVNSSKGGYNISCVNCIFSSCMFPSAGTQSVLILKQPLYVMVPVHLKEPWYENTGVQAWVDLSKALRRARRFLGWLIVSLLALAALSATAAAAGLALSQRINDAYFVNQLSQNTSLALSLQSHIDLQINNKLDEFKNAVLGIGDQMAALKLMRLACHAKYTWICVTPYKYNGSIWEWEKVKMHLLSVWSDNNISLDLKKLNAEIQDMQNAHLDDISPEDVIQTSLDHLKWLNAQSWITGRLSGFITLAVICLLLLIIFSCVFRILMQQYTTLGSKLHGISLQQKLKNKKGEPVGSSQP
ncbi:endogenous retrovirus group K member 6 Env polyprotein [Delphinus delphis]|uniref:endogenous retrovirus group K member 6 Env polyprotein n=1 Tax=Delphinus delphis TaxID=9728 RepID=UPI003750F29C